MTRIDSKTAFEAFVARVENTLSYKRPRAFGVGIATRSSDGRHLDTWYPFPNHEANYGTAAVLAKVLGYRQGQATRDVVLEEMNEILEHFEWCEGDGKVHGNVMALKQIRFLLGRGTGRNSFNQGRRSVVVCFIPAQEEDAGPNSVADAYLRLHLLSHRLVRPHGIKLDGIFAALPNNVWTSEGAVHDDDFTARQFDSLRHGRPLLVHSRDKFPRMLDYVQPSGVRVADANRVRLGAYLGEGTTVMHEGFVNFNAGTLGKSMVEGRISAGVVVGDGSDIGGGASIMGTLSGGGKEVITIGQNCLIGANGGTGISLGSFCTIEAGLYVTAAKKIQLEDGSVVKAGELSGQDEMFFICDSQSGVARMIRRKNSVELNKELHKNV